MLLWGQGAEHAFRVAPAPGPDEVCIFPPFCSCQEAHLGFIDRCGGSNACTRPIEATPGLCLAPVHLAKAGLPWCMNKQSWWQQPCVHEQCQVVECCGRCWQTSKCMRAHGASPAIGVVLVAFGPHDPVGNRQAGREVLQQCTVLHYCAQVLWETLNMPPFERYAWRALAYPFVAFFVLFPVGIFLGAVTNLAVVVCNGNLEGSGCGALDGGLMASLGTLFLFLFMPRCLQRRYHYWGGLWLEPFNAR